MREQHDASNPHAGHVRGRRNFWLNSLGTLSTYVEKKNKKFKDMVQTKDMRYAETGFTPVVTTAKGPKNTNEN